MLNGISKLLTGDMLKILCDMGHGDTIVIADANFPAEAMSKRLIRYAGVDACTVLREICKVFPLDSKTYADYPVAVLDLVDNDKKNGMKEPKIWSEYTDILENQYGEKIELGKISREDFYEYAKKAYVVIQTGEERQYGDILLTKGCVL